MKMRTKNVTLGMMLVILLTTCSTFAGLADGLMAYYPFNGNTNDESGNGYDLTPYGGAAPTEDEVEFAISRAEAFIDRIGKLLEETTTEGPFRK